MRKEMEGVQVRNLLERWRQRNRRHICEDSEYVKNAWEFLKFYELLPDKLCLIITPRTIGVRMPDGFGKVVKSYLELIQEDPRHTAAYQQWFLKENEHALGGKKGVKLFQEYSLQVMLRDQDETFPIIYMYAFCSSRANRKRCMKIINTRYGQRFAKTLKFLHFKDD